MATLRLKKSRQIIEDDDEQTEELFEPLVDPEDVLSEAINSVKSKGLSLPKRPTKRNGAPLDPEFPSDLSSVDGPTLGRLLSEYALLVDYAEGQLALFDTRHVITQHNEKVARVIGQLSSKGSIKDREASALIQHQSYLQSRAYLVRRAEYKILFAIHSGYVNKYKSISREISRRAPRAEGRD